VQLNASTAGSYSGTLSFATNDSLIPTFSLTVSGTVNAAGTTGSLALTITGLPTSGHVPEGSPITLGSQVNQSNVPGNFRYAWTATKNGTPFATGTSANFTFTPDDTGSYAVSLTVTDPSGATGTASQTLFADDLPPTVASTDVTGRAQFVINFAATGSSPSPVDNASLQYYWDFGDGTHGTGANPTHVYAQANVYTVTVTVTDKDGLSAAATISATVTQLAPTGNFITTPQNNIPNFGANPTITSVRSGSWSDPNTWSLGRLPTTGDVVSIAANTTVSYDAVSTAALNTVVIQSGGHLDFRTDVTTKLTLVNLLVLQGGELQIGTAANPVAANVQAEVVFANQPLVTTNDPEQFGHGLIGLGTVTIHGATKDQTFVCLAIAPTAGATTLTLSQPVSGWQVGDQLVLPDSRQLYASIRGDSYVDEIEAPTIAAISADGRVITLASPLRYDHPGAQDFGDHLNLMPHVANRSRNVMIHSESPTGTRGYVLFTDRANVDVEYAAFLGLGRTTNDATDNTTFDSQGNVSHVGTNEDDRNPVTFLHLLGPSQIPANGYQYTFVGNVVFCPLEPMPFRWGITIADSSYGLVKDNVVDNWAGAGIITEMGSESYNVIEHNFVIDVSGDGDKSTLGLAGNGYWFRSPNNYVRDNVATVISPQWGEDEYGFDIYVWEAGSARIPAFQGADPSQPGQSITIDLNTTPILQFSGNETYGATPGGLTVWDVGVFGGDLPLNPSAPMAPSVIQGMTVWNVESLGVYMYPTDRVTLDHLVVRGNASYLQYTGFSTVEGVIFGDYLASNFTLTNADIRGVNVGFDAPVNTIGPVTIENSTFNNLIDINISTAWSVSGGLAVRPRQVVIQNDLFNAVPGLSHQSIQMSYRAQGDENLIQSNQVMVYSYNGVAGDNFQVYYLEQDPNFIVPQTDSAYLLVGSPDAGLTNQQLWNLYHVAVGGALSPTTQTRTDIHGFVRAF
jgi:PKD repeat protein